MAYTIDLNNKLDIIVPSYKIFNGVLSKGLIAYYALDDNLASTYVTDNTKRGYGTASTNTSTLYSASGKVEGCFDFRGGANNDYVTITGLEATAGQYLDYGKPFSVSMWVKPDDVTAGTYAHLLSNNGFTTLTNNMARKGAALDWYWRSSSSYNITVTTNCLTVGVWTHCVFTYNGGSDVSHDGGNIKIYADGTPLVLSADGDSGLINSTCANTASWYLGMYPGDTTRDYDGKMDQVCVWNRELSAGEVSELYNSGNGRFPIGSTYRLSQESAERISTAADRDFSSDTGDWAGTNWAVTGGGLKHTAGNTAAAALTDPANSLEMLNKRTLVTFDITGSTTGSVTPQTANGEIGIAITGNSTSNKQILENRADSGKFSFVPSSGFDGSLDNVSLKFLNDLFEVGFNGNITHHNFYEYELPLPNQYNVVMVYYGMLATAAAPAAPYYTNAGAFYYDTNALVFKMYDGATQAWVEMSFTTV